MRWLLASGFLWAWGYLVHLLASGFFASGGVGDVGFAESSYLAAAFAGYGLAVVLSERDGRRVEVPVSWVGCAAMLAGSFVPALQIAGAPVSAVWLQVGSCLGGAGMAFCATMWGVCLARVDFDALEATALSWCAVFAGVMFAVALASLVPVVLQVVAVGLLVGCPLVAQIGLAAMLAEARATGSERGPEDAAVLSWPPSRADLGAVANLFFAFLALSFIWFAISSPQEGALGATAVLFAFAALVLWAVLWVALRNTRRFGLSTLYRWALPLTVASVACASLGMAPLGIAAFAMVFVANLGFEVVAKMFFVIIGRHWRGHEALAFALGMAAINLAGLSASFLGTILQGLLPPGGWGPWMLFALVAFAVAVSVASGGSRTSLTGVAVDGPSGADCAPGASSAAGKGRGGLAWVPPRGSALGAWRPRAVWTSRTPRAPRVPRGLSRRSRRTPSPAFAPLWARPTASRRARRRWSRCSPRAAAAPMCARPSTSPRAPWTPTPTTPTPKWASAPGTTS